MNILILVSSLNRGGAEKNALFLADFLGKNNNRVFLGYTFRNSVVPACASGCFEVVDLSSLHLASSLSKTLKIRSFLKEKNISIVISFLTNVNVVAIISSLFLKIPVVIAERKNLNQSNPFFLELCTRVFYRFCALSIVQTNRAKSQFISKYNIVPVVIPNPIDDVSSINRNARHELSRRVVLAGRIRIDKGLIESIECFIKANPGDWTLAIYGDGPDVGYLVEYISANNLGSFVSYHGGFESLSDISQFGDVFFFLSKYEGYPNIILESISLHIPIVAFDVPFGVSEIFSYGDFGFLVADRDFDAAIHQLNKLMSSDALLMRFIYSDKSAISYFLSKDRVGCLWLSQVNALVQAYGSNRMIGN